MSFLTKNCQAIAKEGGHNKASQFIKSSRLLEKEKNKVITASSAAFTNYSKVMLNLRNVQFLQVLCFCSPFAVVYLWWDTVYARLL